MHIYAQHFNLNTLPFENVPDPLFFYDQGDYARIRKQISGSLQSGRGLIVVTGPIGSGKTTLSQMIKADFPKNIKLIWMAEPPANGSDLYLFLAQELGLQLSSSEKTFVMRDIRNALLKINSEGEKCLIIIDESHLMSDDVINGVRLLNNLEEGSIKLIQLLLLGQEELLEMINRPAMEPFKQRIATLETLGRMNADAVKRYISHRIKVAGGTPDLIADTGWEALSIAFQGGGTPRTINSLCDRSLSVAFEREKPIVDAHDIYEATQRLGLRTDVFHYIVSLKNQERKTQEMHAAAQQNAPATTSTKASPSKVPPPSTEQQSVSPASIKTKQSAHAATNEAPNALRKRIKVAESSYADIANVIKAKYKQKNLKMPVALLAASMLSLVVSLVFFCHRTDSIGFIGCIMDLLSL